MDDKFLQKLRNAREIQKWVHPNGATFTVIITSESMGYKTDYKPVPVLYVHGTHPDGREDERHKRFTGKNIKRFFDAIITRGWVRC